MKPLISIIVPCYNQGKYLDHSLRSVYSQSYANWECIIVNDGSTDNSESIGKTWVDKDLRFQYYCKENSGVSATRNYALERVNGEYIQFLDADDILDSRKLEASLSLLSVSNDENEKLVITNFRMFTVSSNDMQGPYCNLSPDLFTFDNLLYKWNESFSIPIHCGFFEASLFENIRFPENLTAQEDWIVWVEIFKLNVKTIFLDESLAFYRQNPDSRTKIKSIYRDQMLAYEYFKTILSKEEYRQLSKTLISRYYIEQEEYKKRLHLVKNSNSYQTGLMIKKALKKILLLSLFRKLLPFLLKFKSK